MARLSKKQLLKHVEDSFAESGWDFFYLSNSGAHPARFHIYRNNQRFMVRVYIWNLTHGGGAARPEDEYRIQITGFAHFEPEPEGVTLILGWWDDAGVFAGFDYRHHSGILGSSPSIQIREPALRTAAINGFAPYNKGSGELAIAFRPDFIGAYIENIEHLHDCGKTNSDREILMKIANEPDSVQEEEIETNVSRKRRYAIASTRRVLRDINFRDRVLTAYKHHCAFCGIQLKLLDSAHILPASHPASNDLTSNGIALCALHHRAYDRSLITFDPSFRTKINLRKIQELKETGHDGGLKKFSKNIRPILILPPDRRDRPRKEFIQKANRIRGW